MTITPNSNTVSKRYLLWPILISSLLGIQIISVVTMVVVATLRRAPRTAWSWTLVTVLGCVVLFAVARPALVGG